jgi:hypothetical protein
MNAGLYLGLDLAQNILNLGSRWKVVVSFTLRSHYSGEAVSGTYWMRSSVETVVKRKISGPPRNRTQALQPYLCHYPALTTLHILQCY